MVSRVKTIGNFLASEFNSVAKVYFAPLIGICKGRPLSYTQEAWQQRDMDFEHNLAALKRAF